MEQSALRNAAMAHLVTILCSIHSRVEHFRFVGLAFTLNDADMQSSPQVVRTTAMRNGADICLVPLEV